MSSWHAPGKIYNLGHAAINDLLFDEVLVEEKVDGSFFAFGVFDGVLKCRSKGQEIDPAAPPKMFEAAVVNAQALQPLLHPGWMYRGEYLSKPKHNVLAYERVPQRNFILFDICVSEERYLGRIDKEAEAARLGLEIVPVLAQGKFGSLHDLKALLNQVSVLGGQKIEGVVVKNYARFGRDDKALMGKYVSEDFKEVHKGEWRKENPTDNDILSQLAATYRTPARWNKAIQNLRERDLLTGTPRDIAALVKAAQTDLADECGAEIRDALWNWAWRYIARTAVSGIAEHYKELLAQSAFESATEEPKAA